MAKKPFLSGYKKYDTSEGHGNPGQWKAAFQQRMTKDQAEAILKDQPKSPYEILGVSTNATPQELKAARNALIKRWHPDLNADNLEEANRQSVAINAAYTYLTE